MKPMGYNQAVNFYTPILLDRAKMLSDNIFTIIDGICDGLPADSIQDIMQEWIEERKTIITEIK